MDEQTNLKTIIVKSMIFMVAVAIIPVSILWSINTLFQLGIPYTIETIAAVAVLIFVMKSDGRQRLNQEQDS